MSSAQSLWESFLIMLICIFASIVLILGALMPGEYMYQQVQDTGIMDVPAAWQASDNNDYYISLGYWLTYLLSFFGVGQFVWTSIRRQKYDQFGFPIED